MRGFTEAMGKAASHSTDHFQHALNKFTEAMANPNWAVSRDAAQAAWQEFKDACTNVQQDAQDGIKDELDELREKLTEQYKEQFKEYYDLKGMSETESEAKAQAEAEKMFEERWNDVKDRADFAHPRLEPRYGKIAREGSKAWRWLVAGAAALAVTGFVLSHPAPKTTGGSSFGPELNPVVTNPVPNAPDLDPIMHPEKHLHLITVFQQDNKSATLDAPAAVAPQAMAILPAAVQVIAQQPVVATVSRNGVTQSTVTSLGDFYYHVPDSRHDIEEAAVQANPDAASPEEHHHFLDANPNNTLHSGETNPRWKQPDHLKSLEGNWDGRRGTSFATGESH